MTADHGNDPSTPSHRPLARARAGPRRGRVRAGRRRPRPRATRSPISGRRWPSSSAWSRSRTAEFPLRARAVDRRYNDRMSIREDLEARERDFLAPQAAKSRTSKGRLRPEAEDPIRPVFQRDRDRVIHSKAFRRLKHKTQVFFAPTGDHYRTRLTHTLEVSQIARSIAKVLRLHEELTEAIALGHDLGHPPFGHAGERVLDQLAPGRLQPLRAESSHRRRPRKRPARPEPHVGGARRHRAATRRASTACPLARRPSIARARSKDRLPASPTSSRMSTTTSTTRSGRAFCDEAASARRGRSPCSAARPRSASTRMVTDVVHETIDGGLARSA